MKLQVLYEDNHLLGVFKPAGMLVQGDRTGDVTLLEVSKSYLKEKYGKPGNVFLGLVHRIDRPVSGVVLFARTSKAASRLANTFRTRRADKTYLAVVRGSLEHREGELHAFIERVRMRSRMATSEKGGKSAVLTYRLLDSRGELSLVEVTPLTGRHHQIRLQLAHDGHPIVGDLKYGAPSPLEDRSIALHAAALELDHPTREERIRIAAPPPAIFPWSQFGVTISARFGTDA